MAFSGQGFEIQVRTDSSENKSIGMRSQVSGPCSPGYGLNKTYLVLEDLRKGSFSGAWSRLILNTSKPVLSFIYFYNILQAFKLLAHWYMAPSKLAYINPKISPNCRRRCEERRSYLHCWFEYFAQAEIEFQFRQTSLGSRIEDWELGLNLTWGIPLPF